MSRVTGVIALLVSFASSFDSSRKVWISSPHGHTTTFHNHSWEQLVHSIQLGYIIFKGRLSTILCTNPFKQSFFREIRHTHARIYTHKHTHTHAHTHTHTHTPTPTNTHTHTHTHTHPHTHTKLHTHTTTYTPKHTLTHTPKHKHTAY